MLVSAGVQGAYAITGDEVAADKSYTAASTRAEEPGGDWEGYRVDVSFDVKDGKFANINIDTPGMDSSNWGFKVKAKQRIKTLEGKPATLATVNGLDAKTGATFTTQACKDAIRVELKKADAATKAEPVEEAKTLYGKVNLPYADFYYGELNNLTAVSNDLKADAVDKAASLRADGMYDAVTSSTKNKFKSFFPTTYNSVNEDGSGKILGVKDVNVAIDKALYDKVKKAIAEGKTSKNPLFDIVKNMTLNEGNAQPKEYKAINGDGTLTATKGDGTVVNPATATISTINRYGNYGIKLSGEGLPAAKDVDGVILKTSDGSMYAMKHLENIWVKTYEISFAVKPDFVEPHGNRVNYKAYTSIEGKTITEIRYMVHDGDDVVVKTSLLCKKIPGADASASVNNAVFSEGVAVTSKVNAPADAAYKLSEVKKGKTVLEEGKDYTVSGDKITFKKTDNTGIGAYTAVFTSEKYGDLQANFQLKSNHADGSVKIEGNKLVLPADLDKDTYYASISSVLVDGKPLRGRDLAKLIFGDDQTVNFNAEISGKGGVKTPIFTKGEDGSYEIELVSDGYPSVKATISPKKQEEPKPQPKPEPKPEPQPQPGNNDNVQLTVKVEKVNKELKGYKADEYEAYDIYFVNANGDRVKPNGKQRVTVELKNLEPKNLHIFHEKHDGTLEEIPVTSISGKTVTFENDDFSVYYFANVSPRANGSGNANRPGPNTFDGSGLAGFAVLGAGAAIAFAALSRRKKAAK
jgi:choline-binding protein